MDMKLSDIYLKGWRSFDAEQGIKIVNLKRINLFIGPNNSGKSNLFKYLFYLKEKVLSNVTSDMVDYTNYDLINNLDYNIPKRDTWADNNEDIVCDLFFSIDQEDTWFSEKPLLTQERENIHLKSQHKVKSSKASLSVMYNDQIPLLESYTDKPKIYSSTDDQYIDIRSSMPYLSDTLKLWYKTLSSMVFIDPIRHYSREASAMKESDFDGSNIINNIINLHNDKDRATEFRQYRELIEECLIDILGENELELDVTKDEVRFFIERGSKKICAYLEQLGTGVSQFFMILSYLYINKDRDLNIFMEEPESNLHPDGLVKLLDIIKVKFPNHTFFISTHSSILIDQIDDDWSLHQVHRKNSSPSVISSCNTVIQKHSLLDDLGIRASQLLQSNMIIWVEGPSDRVYLKKWIQDLCSGPHKLREGKHYSFVIYGGSNLSNYDIFNPAERIDMIHLGRNAVIICDSDKTQENDELKTRVKNIGDRIDQVNELRERNPTQNHHSLKLWVTQGREIENYIPQELLLSILSSKDFVKRYIMVEDDKGKKKRENIIMDVEPTDSFGEFDSFDEFVASLYRREDGTLLNDQEYTKLASSIAKDKNIIAIKMCEEWSVLHYNQLDIKEKVEEIIKLIYLSNGLNF
ncbi:AAA family ATPase [Oceanobacillus sp. 1P07AA]|uniref:AAA family ATPase n=1 Tax=Oceanobacillus sp. 1P07AA TaxID=3132293 RepID=UPI0039A688E9